MPIEAQEKNERLLSSAKRMPNIGGPGPLKRRIILTVVTSIMLFDSPI